MTIYIQYYTSDCNKILEYLKHIYPNQIETINNIIKSRTKYIFDYILIENDIIKQTDLYDFRRIPTIVEDAFINGMNILTKCDNKSFIIKNATSTILNIDIKNKYNYVDDVHLIYVNDGYYCISDTDIKIFFKNIKKIEVNEYMRSIKLKQII